MAVDMSPEAVTKRLQEMGELCDQLMIELAKERASESLLGQTDDTLPDKHTNERQNRER
jgi:hypothetical protein